MNKNPIALTVGFDPGHGSNTPGKCSPDKTLREYKWAREEVALIMKKLEPYKGKVNAVNLVPEDYDVTLSERCKRMNNLIKPGEAGRCLFVSIHCNAAGNQDKWMNARGWESHCARKCSPKSILFADLLWNHAEGKHIPLRRPSRSMSYWPNDFYVLKHTSCPAVLIENMFQDNKDDVAYLLSDKGRNDLADIVVEAILEYADQ